MYLTAFAGYWPLIDGAVSDTDGAESEILYCHILSVDLFYFRPSCYKKRLFMCSICIIVYVSVGLVYNAVDRYFW